MSYIKHHIIRDTYVGIQGLHGIHCSNMVLFCRVIVSTVGGASFSATRRLPSTLVLKITFSYLGEVSYVRRREARASCCVTWGARRTVLVTFRKQAWEWVHQGWKLKKNQLFFKFKLTLALIYEFRIKPLCYCIEFHHFRPLLKKSLIWPKTLLHPSQNTLPKYSWHLSRYVVLDDKLVFGYQLLLY